MFYVGLLGNIFSKLLAHYLFITFSIEQVISNLKCETQRFSVLREVFKFLTRGLARHCPNPYCGSNECSSLVAMDIFKYTSCAFFPVIEHIYDLSGNHPLCPGCVGYFVKHLPSKGCRCRRSEARVCHHPEGFGQQRVSCEQGDRFAKHLVTRRSAPAQVIVVYAREVIVDKGIRMNHFNSTSKRKHRSCLAIFRIAHRKRQYGPDPFSFRE